MLIKLQQMLSSTQRGMRNPLTNLLGDAFPAHVLYSIAAR